MYVASKGQASTDTTDMNLFININGISKETCRKEQQKTAMNE